VGVGEGVRGRGLAVLPALLLLASTATAQFEIDWWTIDDGSEVLTDGTFELRGTIGQPDASEVRTNAVSSMGGFWSLDYVFCLADLTTQGAGIGDPDLGVPDGLVTAADINYYVNAWVNNDIAIADLTTQGAGIGDPDFGVPDGLATGADINFYVNLWVAGCT